MSPIAVDLFAGAGGFSLGLTRAGFDVVLAVDNDPVAVKTYNRNLGNHAQVLDLSTTSALDDLEARLKDVELDLVVGGPPCQGFSLQRRGTTGDPRNHLVQTFSEAVARLRPRAFVMENVPALMSKRGQAFAATLVDDLDAIGYSCVTRTINALDFGVAQNRRRAFIVGMRDVAPFSWPTDRPGGPATVRDAIGDLPSPPVDGSPHPDIANHYREARLSALNRERIRHVPQGGGREHLPEHLRLACHADGHRHLDTYGRLAWCEPAVTITARFDSFTRGRFGHPEEDRSLTLREGARLQGFPDWFTFAGNREDGARLIGNAVPPPLAEAVARGVCSQLSGIELDRLATQLSISFANAVAARGSTTTTS